MSCRCATIASPPRPAPEASAARATPHGALAPAGLVVFALLLLAVPAGAGVDEAGARLGPVLTRFAPPPRAAPGHELRLGLVLGDRDPLAESRRRGAELAALWLDALGGPAVSLRVGRARGPWSSTADAARTLLCEQGCQALITPPDGDSAHLLAQLATRYHAPLVALGSSASLTRVPLPWLAQIVPDDRAQLRTLLTDLARRPERPVPALIPAGRAGRRIRADLAAVGDSLGVAFDVLPVDARFDARRLGPQVRSEQPVIVWLDGAPALDALDALSARDWRGPVLLPQRSLDAAWTAAPAGASLACRSVRTLAPGRDLAAFAEAYRRLHGVPPDEAAACAFDATVLLASVLRSADGAAPFARWTRAPALPGVTGPLLFGPTGERLRAWSVTALPRRAPPPAAALSPPSSGT